MSIALSSSINSKSVKLREQKGKSIITFPESYCVIDIETTGLYPAYDSIIEISAIKISSNNITDTFSLLVQPPSSNGQFVDDFITQLTGITNEMLSNAQAEKEVIPMFQEFIGSSILVGHNVHFDINFLYDSFENILNVPLTNDFIDTMRIAKKLHKELSHHRLSDIAELYNEYSCAMKSHFRKSGNQMSGKWKSSYHLMRVYSRNVLSNP